MCSKHHFLAGSDSPHWLSDVRKYLEHLFPGLSIGRGCPTPWPTLSYDITPCGFFFFGRLLRISFIVRQR